jgi:hypothetical protein
MAQAVPFIIAAVAAVGQGVAAYKKSQYHTKQAKASMEAKNRRMAAATREAAEERRRAQFIRSRARAVAAFSGGGTDAGMVKVFADLAAEGEYRVLSRVWQGQNDAQGLIAQSEANFKAARDAKVMGVFNSITSAFAAYSGAGGGANPNPGAGATNFSSSSAPQMSPIQGYQDVGKLWLGPAPSG